MLEKLVAFCYRWPWAILAVTLTLAAGGVYLTASRFAIDTDTAHLFSPQVPWRRNEAELYRAFPQLDDVMVAVIDANTPEQADDAAGRLQKALAGKPLMSRIWRPDDNDFFRTNGLLFLDTTEIQR
ncbi:MAG: hopanoid biosynthesis-associated RND transporter HpnN, partial [Methylocystis sp.]|nr:hopanoid biosynthesis-associated RND transporter HpnN [Methylocystis sp.]